jgi:spore maturation protein SpmA
MLMSKFKFKYGKTRHALVTQEKIKGSFLCYFVAFVLLPAAVALAPAAVALAPAALALPPAGACACASLAVYSAIVANAVSIIAAVITKSICLYINMFTTKKYIWVFTNLLLDYLYWLSPNGVSI